MPIPPSTQQSRPALWRPMPHGETSFTVRRARRQEAARSSRSNAWQKRARRTVFCAIATFVLVQLIAGLVLDRWFLNVKFPSAANTFAVLAQRDHSPEVVGFGSSRFGAGFDQELLHAQLTAHHAPLTTHHSPLTSHHTVFNAAIEAGDLVTADFLLEGMIQRGMTPRLAVVEISPETLAARNEWVGLHVLRQLTWSDLPGHFLDVCRSGNVMRLLNARCLPLYLHRRQVRRESYDAVRRLLKSTRDSKGKKANREVADTRGVDWDVLLGMHETRPRDSATLAGLPAIQRWLKDYEVGGAASATLERLVQRCRDHDVRIVLVGVPVARAHRALYAPTIEEAFQSRLAQVTHRYKDCHFIDARAWIADELFHDNHHLSRAGGREFSERLAGELRRLPTCSKD